MLGIGIIGAGRICRAHATAAAALLETRLVAVADVDPARVTKAANAYDCRGCDSYQALLEAPDVEAVVVGLPHRLHHEVTVAALQAGRHVLLEKPMAMTSTECDTMIDAARASGRTLMVAHSQHFFPVNLEVRRLLREGEIGSIVLATDTWYKPFLDGERPAWFLDDAQGGGMWPMNGSHMIDRLTFLIESEVVAVKARVGNPIYGFSTDMGVALLEFANGVCATIVHAGYRDGVNRFEGELTGTEGQVRFGGDRGLGPLWRSRDRQWLELPVPVEEMPTKAGADPPSPVFGAQMREFALAIQEARPPSVSGEYGRQIVAVMEACVESSRTGREVRLEQGNRPIEDVA